MISPEMTLSYPALFEAKPNPSGDLKFSCSLLIDKSDKEGVKEIQDNIERAKAKGKSTIWGGKIPNFRYKPLRDGDEELASGEKTDPVYKGKFFLNCSSNEAPGVVGPDAKPLMDRSAIYAGCVVRADVNPFPYKNSGNSGVGWGLNNVMLVREGERLDGRQKAEDAFASHAVNEEGNEDLM